MLRVALVNYTAGEVSGTGRHVALLARGLSERGVKVKVVTLRDAWHIDIPVLRAASFTLGVTLKQLEADVVHVHNPKLAGLALKQPSRTVVTVHGGMIEFSLKYGGLGRLATKAMNRLLRQAGAVTSVMMSEAEKNRWIWVPNMTDLRAIEAVKPASDSYVLFVGRNDPIKNYPLFKKVVERLGVPYKAFGVEEVASWERVIAHMKSADCLTITSLWEGMPSVLLEAWAARCPVIAPVIPAFTPFQPALILARHSLDSYIEAYRLLDSRRSEVVEHGYTIVSKLDYPNVTSKYISIYEGLLTRF